MVVATKSASELAPVYDAVVIGSGYGGGVAASRLSRMGYQVAVLEQGRPWQPGEFPTTIKARCMATRISGRHVRLGDPTGLFRLTVGNGLTVLSATGMGGGSLINAGVVRRPDPQRLREAGWPDAVLDDGRFEKGLDRAEKMLGAAPLPVPERFAKFAGMQRAATAVGATAQLPSITIAHRSGPNPAGVYQNECQYCGDCWSGCNAGAKNTVGITYIADAVHHGAEVFCRSRVEAIARAGNDWEITVKDLSGTGGSNRIAAGILVLAAGTLGTTELLLRAQSRGLALSGMLGRKFSANGDDMVIAAELEEPVNAIATGYPPRAPQGAPVVGPHSIAMIDLRDESGSVMMVQDGAMPTMMAALAPVKALMERRFGRALELFRGGIYCDALNKTQVYYIVGHDDAGGRLALHKDRITIDWPEYSNSARRVAAEEKVKAMIEEVGGVFQTNPFNLAVFGGNRVIAHPLGGCALAESADKGVVAPDGRVFDPGKGPEGVHEGLYVCDGALVPSALGVSPLLTIAALAERTMMLAADRLGRKLDVFSSPGR